MPPKQDIPLDKKLNKKISISTDKKYTWENLCSYEWLDSFLTPALKKIQDQIVNDMLFKAEYPDVYSDTPELEIPGKDDNTIGRCEPRTFELIIID